MQLHPISKIPQPETPKRASEQRQRDGEEEEYEYKHDVCPNRSDEVDKAHQGDGEEKEILIA